MLNVPHRLRVGHLWIDSLTFAAALQALATLVERGHGGAVFTPNVDHVVNAEGDLDFRHAYQRADFCFVDGTPLLWASRALGWPLPEKISGSDLVLPLMHLSAERGWRVYLFGGGTGVARQAATLLESRHGVQICGWDDPQVGARGACAPEALDRMRQARPQVVLAALGSPKQELFIQSAREALRPAVLLGIGAGLDFLVGAARRAPKWMSNIGLEWLYRLIREPRRLWRRYLVNDPRFAWVLYRALHTSYQDRVALRLT